MLEFSVTATCSRCGCELNLRSCLTKYNLLSVVSAEDVLESFWGWKILRKQNGKRAGVYLCKSCSNLKDSGGNLNVRKRRA